MQSDTTWGKRQVRRVVAISAVTLSVALVVNVGDDSDAVAGLQYAVVAE
ncbi:hypothetical protein [Nocardioides daphniae]|uniref:Uncharacterized protein n=1 Tax=Nocardioides daphniae TaxID=402297 RepID=A0ABQ1Q6M2_9ACTN|nr:hypothetical protein [Nocardioides daphniae]GGD15604.1 hypothetical protein GCM10007231_13290 [Nocardioides daphniae]